MRTETLGGILLFIGIICGVSATIIDLILIIPAVLLIIIGGFLALPDDKSILEIS